ncbi:zinc finger protein 474-like [Limulus polyphemus]|uniref:Zinc finger protein 474-like n=1 Tax=Limulus polyphemus TaxID=6850 RepID=A0ABM1BAZ5_LIMPO|nr:zinc finger protein 474-like [Limulus polyphemus]
MEDSRKDGEVLSERLIRPQTKTLDRPTHNFDLPVVDSDPETCKSKNAHKTVAVHRFSRYSMPPQNDFHRAVNKKPKQVHSKNTKHSPGSSTDRSYDSIQAGHNGSRIPLTQPGHNSKNYFYNRRLPLPCKTCTRSVAPERLHSHSTNGWNKFHKGQISKKHAEDKLKESDTKHNQNIETDSSVEEKVETSKNDDSTKRVNKRKTRTKSKVSTFQQSRRPVAESQADESTSDSYAESTNSKVSSGPLTTACYVCGQEFDSHLISNHEPQCLQKWRLTNEALPQEQRHAEPQKPESDNTSPHDDYNDASWQAFQAQLVPCPNCGRTFFPDRLPVHQRACKSKSNGGARKTKVVNNYFNKETEELQAPREIVQKKSHLITCYICGQESDTNSVSFHESQCLQKRRIENCKLSKETKRPESPKHETITREDDTTDYDAMAQEAWQIHLEQLVPCCRCGRTFFPDRLAVHSRSCKGQGQVAEHSPRLPTRGTEPLEP